MAKDYDTESEMLKQMFDEIMRMIQDKKIKLEAIVQRLIDHDIISQDTFDRVYRTLTEHGKKKKWL